MEAKERARSAYARGQAAFAQGDYAVAQASFEEAYANVPNPIVLLSIAESAAKQGRIDAALKAYDTYLQKRPDAPDREEVAQKRASLAQAPAEVTLLSEPQGADIVIDGQLTGRRTPAIMKLSPGSHQISAVMTGYESDAVAVQVSAGVNMEQTLALRAPPPPPPAAALPPPEQKPLEKAQPPTAALVVTGSLGAAGLIAGTVLGILALSERSDYNKNPTEAGADRGERLALFADVGFGVGAMALVTTAVLLLTHDDVKAPEQATQQTSRLELIPSVTPRGASATAKVRF